MSPFGEFPQGGGGGGGVAGPTNPVVGSPASNSKIIIPGLSGSPDVKGPTTGNGALSDEFDENTSGVPSGWTACPWNGATISTADVLSLLHITATTSTAQANGIYKAAPTSFPFTVTAKLNDLQDVANFQRAGLFVAQSTPGSAGSLWTVGLNGREVGGLFPTLQWTADNQQTGAGGTGNTIQQQMNYPLYLRAIVTATSVHFMYSRGGR